MNNIVILVISVIILLIIFLVTLIMISKSKIQEVLTSVEISNDDINNSLKQKYKIYKEMTNYLKDNLSIKENAFQNFLEFNSKECSRTDLINILDKTTFEINDYVDNYDDLLKNQDFINIKRKLYHVEMNLEAAIEYYNNKLKVYNDLIEHSPTSIASKIFSFDEYENLEINKEEISRLINLN